MSDTNRKTITDYKYINARFLIETTVRSTIESLQALEMEGWVGMDYDYSDSDVIFTQTRLENDEEYNHRIAMEKDAEDRAKKHKERDRECRHQDYLKLKEEFGND
jgi:hypothetical protein